jgi:hypothetical protein
MTTPRIESYQFGEIVIDGQRYTRDVIITPDRVQTNWRREEGHNLVMSDLEDVLGEPPTVLVIGQGAYGRMVVPEETRRQLEAMGIEVIIEASGDACQSYNRLREGSVTVAALHLTC